MGSSSFSVQIPVSFESTQAIMNQMMQQLNSEGLFNITESTDDNPYNFTDLRCNTNSVNEEKVDTVIQETPRDMILDSQKIIGQGINFNKRITILEIQRTIHGLELEEIVGLLHQIHDTIVAIAKISFTATVNQLHNRLQPKGYYKVSIQDAIVDDTPLIITNIDDDPL